MNYKREVIGDNIGFSTIIDEKFNTCSLSVKFITELDSGYTAENEMLSGMLSMSNGKIKSFSEMNKTMQELYAASISGRTNTVGYTQVITFSASWICNRFALENENITESMLEIVHDCIFSPNTENSAFDSKNFKICQKCLIDDINSILNDKREYAIMQAKKTAFKGEPIENSFIEIEDAEKVTPESVFKAYEHLLETSQIEIFYVAPEENTAVSEMFRKGFSEITRNSRQYTIYSNSPIKAKPEKVTEELPVNQSKMILLLKSDSDDSYAMNMLSIILGGTPVSKLFMNVREKLSLCYYCSCRYIKNNVILIESGVDKENIQKAYDEIFNQIEEIRNGNISEEEMQAVIKAIDDSLSGVGDTPVQYVNWYFDRFCAGEIITPHQYFDKFCSVTKESIIDTAKSLKPDTSYYLINKEISE
ncbi:MAG: insulinase family protein [Ruminococcus sp.]|nr:insulinase family protein [Ruminococcus sp.]